LNKKSINSGGFRSEQTKHYTDFFGSLRSYGRSPIYKKPDTLINSQKIIKKEYIPLFKMTSKNQRLLNTYLSKPKYIKQKYVC
jgi:hypothetical protein